MGLFNPVLGFCLCGLLSLFPAFSGPWGLFSTFSGLRGFFSAFSRAGPVLGSGPLLSLFRFLGLLSDFSGALPSLFRPLRVVSKTSQAFWNLPKPRKDLSKISHKPPQDLNLPKIFQPPKKPLQNLSEYLSQRFFQPANMFLFLARPCGSLHQFIETFLWVLCLGFLGFFWIAH